MAFLGSLLNNQSIQWRLSTLVGWNLTNWAQVAVPLSNSPGTVLSQVLVLFWSSDISFMQVQLRFQPKTQGSSMKIYEDLSLHTSSSLVICSAKSSLPKLQSLLFLFSARLPCFACILQGGFANASRQKAWTIRALFSFVSHPSEMSLVLFTV